MHMYMYMHAADKEWKRKFFQEKKFTSTLEDRIKRSKDDLQQLQSQVDRKHGLHIKGQEVRSGPCLYYYSYMYNNFIIATHVYTRHACMHLCLQLPSNQSFYRLIAG